MDKNEILAAVDEALTSVWVNEIRHDYKSGWLLKEDALKNALYFIVFCNKIFCDCILLEIC